MGTDCARCTRRTALRTSCNVVRYDVEKFHALQIPGSSRQTHGTVLISHGFTEFAAKYKEMAWYFLLAGFSVCILEHRGHGYSARDVRNGQIVYIDTWHRYVADLAKCARTIARPMAADKPLVLFAHSMGGGIAAADARGGTPTSSTRPCCRRR